MWREVKFKCELDANDTLVAKLGAGEPAIRISIDRPGASTVDITHEGAFVRLSAQNARKLATFLLARAKEMPGEQRC